MFRTHKAKSAARKVSFNVIAGIFLVVVFVLGSALSKEIYRGYEIKKETEDLKTQINAMQKDNYELSQLIQYYQTDQYKEEAARQQLNLKSDGEKVVMINNDNTNNAQAVQAATNQQKNDSPNYVKWWNYFFASRG